MPAGLLFAEDDKIVLAEEVTDCGPLVDLEKTPGCKLVEEQTDAKAAYPDCCPYYDCEEGTEVVYVEAAKSEEDGESPRTSN